MQILRFENYIGHVRIFGATKVLNFQIKKRYHLVLKKLLLLVVLHFIDHHQETVNLVFVDREEDVGDDFNYCVDKDLGDDHTAAVKEPYRADSDGYKFLDVMQKRLINLAYPLFVRRWGEFEQLLVNRSDNFCEMRHEASDWVALAVNRVFEDASDHGS